MTEETKRPRLMKPLDREKMRLAFGRRLKELREAKHISQAQAAIKSGMEAGNYAKYEGKREPGLAVIMLLAKGLDVHPKELLAFEFDFEIA